MKPKYAIPMILLVLVLALSACAPAVAGGAPAAVRNLNVNGNGTVSIAPDIAHIYIGVHTEGDKAEDAVAANNAQTQKVIDALKAAGIADNDISTSSFGIYSSQRYGPNGEQLGAIYMVDNTVFLTVRDLANLGKTIDAAVQAGANNVNSIQFDVEDKTAALTEARALAVKNAQAQAAELAAAAGVTLGEVQSVSYYESYPGPVYDFGGRGGGGAADMSATVPITPGQYQVTATVSLTYEIK